MSQRVLGLLCLIVLSGGAQDRALAPQGRKLALVIGNRAYARQPLPNPENDATDFAAVLRPHGFEVTTQINLKREEMDGALLDFSSRLNAGDTALVFFAGHGMEVGGENFLLPVDFNAQQEYQVRSRSMAASEILAALRARSVGVAILILDACRNKTSPSRRRQDR